MTGFFTAPRIAWGPGALEQLSGLGARRAIVVVDPAVFALEAHRRVVEELAKSDTVVEAIDAGTGPDRLDSVDRLAQRLREFGPDWVVAVGGGRTIDGAKAARALFERSDIDLRALTPVTDLPDPPKSRFVAIPTTSGSGADASLTADLVSTDGEPFEVAHRSLVPDWAIVDAHFAESLSNELRSDGGAEALGQAVEAYLSAWSSPFSDALSLAVVRTVVERLSHAVKWSDDPDAKEELHYAATLAGIAASNAQRGVAHALARALAPSTGLSYGRLVGIVLPHVLEFDLPSARERLEAIGASLRRPEESSAVPFSTRLTRLYENARIPRDLAEAGVSESAVVDERAAIVARVLKAPAALANPRVPSPTDVETLLNAVTHGRRAG